MLKGFKDFILRGNVVELATAVVIGTAFTAIVTAFTKNIIDPLIASFGGADAADGLGFRILSSNPATFVDLGAVITATINFLIVAAVVYFLLIVPMNKLNSAKTRFNKKGEPVEEETPLTQMDVLEQIRDLLAKQNGTGTLK